MKIFEKIKNLFLRNFSPKNSTNTSTENNISKIDLSNIEIDRNLSKRENYLKSKFDSDIENGDINTLIKYGEDMAREINYYLEVSRKIINQNLELFSPSNNILNIYDAIKQKVRIAFNISEINSILVDLQSIKRNSEIRLLALEDAQERELKQSKKKLFFFSNKHDITRLRSIQTAISRISTTITVINSLISGINIEYYASMKENKSLDTIISQNPKEKNEEIARKILEDLYNEYYCILKALENIDSSAVNLDEYRVPLFTIKQQVEMVTKMKKFIDLYVERNKSEFFKAGGKFEQAKDALNKLYLEIESNYYDWNIEAKRDWKNLFDETAESHFYDQYNEKMLYLFDIIDIYNEYLPKDFKEKVYKTDFLRIASLSEIISLNTMGPIKPPKTEEERTYFLLFIEDLKQQIYTTSTDTKVINFMNKYISSQTTEQILDDTKNLSALLRIYKFGREGLFTLNLFLSDNLRDRKFGDSTLEELNLSEKVASPSDFSYYGTVYVKLFNDNDKNDTTGDNSNSNDFLWIKACQDIYRMWYSKKIKSKVSFPTYKKFAQIDYNFNKRSRMEKSKPEDERLWNTHYLFLRNKRTNYITKEKLSKFMYLFRECIPVYESEVFSNEDFFNILTNIDGFRIDDSRKSHIYYTKDGKTLISLNSKNKFKPGRMDYTEFVEKLTSVYIIQLLSLQKYDFVYDGIYVGNPDKETQIRNNPSPDDELKQALISGIIDFFKDECNFNYIYLFKYLADYYNLKAVQFRNKKRYLHYENPFFKKAIDCFLTCISTDYFLADEKFNKISLLFTPDLIKVIIDNRNLFKQYLENCEKKKNTEPYNSSLDTFIFADNAIDPVKKILKLYNIDRETEK